MDANSELALEAFILLRSDVDSVQYPVVMVKLRDEIQGRGETIRLRGRITNDYNDLLGIWFPIHLFDGSLNRECQVLLPLAAALGLYSSQKSFQLRGRQGQRLYVKRLAFAAVHDDPDARRRSHPMDCANHGPYPDLDPLHHNRLAPIPSITSTTSSHLRRSLPMNPENPESIPGPSPEPKPPPRPIPFGERTKPS